MKNVVFWDVTPCGSCPFVFLRNVRRLLVTANVVPSSPILVTLLMEALSSSVTSVLTRATRRNIPEDGILHSDRREHLVLCAWTKQVYRRTEPSRCPSDGVDERTRRTWQPARSCPIRVHHHCTIAAFAPEVHEQRSLCANRLEIGGSATVKQMSLPSVP
jgi:hypothetical protein